VLHARTTKEEQDVDHEELLRRLGVAIAIRRRALGLTQEDLAERLSSAPEWCSQVERGVGAPSLAMVTRIACVLNTTPIALFAVAGEGTTTRREVVRLLARIERLPDSAVRVLAATATMLEREYGVRDSAPLFATEHTPDES
jgi:transcriptional regulator with XRE-family HTH domain